MICNILSYIIVIVLFITAIFYSKHRIEILVLLSMFVYFYYIYLWKQQYNVYPSKNYKKLKNYNKKVLWINTNVLNVNNPEHVKWCKYILIDSAPNKLGIYIDNPNPEKVFVNRQIEIFKIMFGFVPKNIYFTEPISSEISTFCKLKQLSITYLCLRYTI